MKNSFNQIIIKIIYLSPTVGLVYWTRHFLWWMTRPNLKMWKERDRQHNIGVDIIWIKEWQATVESEGRNVWEVQAFQSSLWTYQEMTGHWRFPPINLFITFQCFIDPSLHFQNTREFVSTFSNLAIAEDISLNAVTVLFVMKHCDSSSASTFSSSLPFSAYNSINLFINSASVASRRRSTPAATTSDSSHSPNFTIYQPRPHNFNLLPSL